jgi:hypothetical protein
MAIQRIDSKRTHGWQARAHTTKGQPRLTKLLSDKQCGGKRKAHELAQRWEQRLKRQVRALRTGP